MGTVSFSPSPQPFSKMDAIKKKMQSLKTETENAMARADQLDAEFRAATTLAEKTEETVRDLQKKMQHVENELDITLEKLTQTTTKFDEKEKDCSTGGRIGKIRLEGNNHFQGAVRGLGPG